jgi:hypothetical protein
MDISLQSLLYFVLITVMYFMVLKPKLTLELLQPHCYNDYKNSIFPKLALYLLIVCLVQFILNTAYLTSKCGGDVNNNIGAAALYTFFPWLIIFGIMIAVLIIFPGFKSAFSDVIGYFVIAGGAKELFSNILVNTDIKQQVDGLDGNSKNSLMAAAEAITKMLGNKSILINQVTPDNFLDFWQLLTPLMKDELKQDNALLTAKQSELLGMVVLKDNIGEAFWYVYTAILISSIVYYTLANRGCVKSVAQIKAGYDQYMKDQEAAEKEKQDNTVTTVMN